MVNFALTKGIKVAITKGIKVAIKEFGITNPERQRPWWRSGSRNERPVAVAPEIGAKLMQIEPASEIWTGR